MIGRGPRGRAEPDSFRTLYGAAKHMGAITSLAWARFARDVCEPADGVMRRFHLREGNRFVGEPPHDDSRYPSKLDRGWRAFWAHIDGHRPTGVECELTPVIVARCAGGTSDACE
jgi:hypothetical protein